MIYKTNTNILSEYRKKISPKRIPFIFYEIKFPRLFKCNIV